MPPRTGCRRARDSAGRRIQPPDGVAGATHRDPARHVERTLAVPRREQRVERLDVGGTDVRELLHDGCPVACVRDAPFAYVNAFKAHANVGFFHGAMLADPAGLLEGAGKRMRHVKLRPGKELNVEALSDLIALAYRDIRRRLTQPNPQ